MILVPGNQYITSHRMPYDFVTLVVNIKRVQNLIEFFRFCYGLFWFTSFDTKFFRQMFMKTVIVLL